VEGCAPMPILNRIVTNPRLGHAWCPNWTPKFRIGGGPSSHSPPRVMTRAVDKRRRRGDDEGWRVIDLQRGMARGGSGGARAHRKSECHPLGGADPLALPLPGTAARRQEPVGGYEQHGGMRSSLCSACGGRKNKIDWAPDRDPTFEIRRLKKPQKHTPTDTRL